MQTKTEIALIHTTPLVLEPIRKALSPLEEQYRFYHMLDEAVLIRMMKDGNTPELTVPWLTSLVETTLRGGAAGVIVSCSSLSPSVASVASRFRKPVIRIDEALYHHVFHRCRKPVVLMTNPTNVSPAKILADEMKKVCGLEADIPFVVCHGAFEALQRGDQAGHDREVAGRIAELAEHHDGIILSQISMERVRESLPGDLRRLVFSSLDFLGDTIERMGLPQLHSS